jgi:hypothetical protein
MRTKALILGLALIVGPLTAAAPATLVVNYGPFPVLALYDYKMKNIRLEKHGNEIRVFAEFKNKGPCTGGSVYVRTTVRMPGPRSPVYVNHSYVSGPFPAGVSREFHVFTVPFDPAIVTPHADVRVTVELDYPNYIWESDEENNVLTEDKTYGWDGTF